jgi:hypothetical protein
MRKFILSCVYGLFSFVVQAQLTVPAAGLTVVSGTTLFTDSLIFTPSADFTMSAVTIQRNNTPVQSISGIYSIDHQYSISAPLTFTGTLGMYYDPAELNGNTESTLQIAYLSGGTWTTTSGGSVNMGTHYIQNTLTGASFQNITATQQGNVLPLQLLEFTASLSGADIILHWQTVQEQNIRSFLVEHSPDARLFSDIGTVAAVGNSTAPVTYSFTQPDPLPGLHFYRLKELDDDGNFTYSKVISIQVKDGIVFSLYPNPASGEVTLAYPNSSRSNEAWLVDASGRIVQKYPLSAGSVQTTLSLAGIARGDYFIQVPNSGMTPLRLFVR